MLFYFISSCLIFFIPSCLRYTEMILFNTWYLWCCVTISLCGCSDGLAFMVFIYHTNTHTTAHGYPTNEWNTPVKHYDIKYNGKTRRNRKKSHNICIFLVCCDRRCVRLWLEERCGKIAKTRIVFTKMNPKPIALSPISAGSHLTTRHPGYNVTFVRMLCIKGKTLILMQTLNCH